MTTVCWQSPHMQCCEDLAFQGISHADFEALQAVRGDDPFFDYLSAVTRPGAWEWPTTLGARLRCELLQLGYRMDEDPVRPWRVRWICDLTEPCPAVPSEVPRAA